MNKAMVVALSVCMCAPAIGQGAGPAVRPMSADQDWCAAVNRAEPGEEIVLETGFYTGGCVIRNSGRPGKPIVLRSEHNNPSKRAVLAEFRPLRKMIDLRRVSHVRLQDLDFAPPPPTTEAIRVVASHSITIQGCSFRKLPNVAIAVNNGSSRDIRIRDNHFDELGTTAIYIGCHDGVSCEVHDVLIEGNVIDAVNPPDIRTGYGIQVKLNSSAVIRDNQIRRTKGPGIMVYGSDNSSGMSLVERNRVSGSLQEAGIVVGGGPAVIRNNIVHDNALNGIRAQDYGRRGLQQNVRILNNTLFGNVQGSIGVENWRAGQGNVIANNALIPPPGIEAFEPLRFPAHIQSNQTCERLSECLDAELNPQGPLLNAADPRADAWVPMQDMYKRKRDKTPDIGAVESQP